MSVFVHDHFSLENIRVEEILRYINNIRKVHTVINNKFLNEDTFFDAFVWLGLEIFDMELAIISEITGSDYYVRGVASGISGIEKGMKFPIEDTLCREVVETKTSMAFNDLSKEEEYKSHPAVNDMNLVSYISAPILVNNKIYGTINFSSREKREKNFSIYDREIIELMANHIGKILEIQSHKKIWKEKIVN